MFKPVSYDYDLIIFFWGRWGGGLDPLHIIICPALYACGCVGDSSGEHSFDQDADVCDSPPPPQPSLSSPPAPSLVMTH